jgi:hypothetical protein
MEKKDVEFSRDLEMQNIILEGDALEIAHALQKEGQFWSRYGQLIVDAKKMLKSLRYVRHVKREANIVVHYLVKAAIQQSFEQI